MNRAEHLQWCKDRAFEYVESGDLSGAVASMMSDLSKHEGTALKGPMGGTLMMVGMINVRNGDRAGVRRWVEGFN